MVWLFKVCRFVFSSTSVLQIDFYPAIRTGQIFHYEEKTGLWIYEVQVKENYQQSEHQRVCDMVLSNYGKLITIQYACVHLIIRFGNRKRF